MLVKNEKSNVLHINGKYIGPGVNQVDPKWWSATREHPTIKRKLESGQLVEEMDVAEVAAAEQLGESIDETVINHITTLSVNNAKALVADTVDSKLLENWMARDTRKTVKDALKKQLDKVKAAPEYRDKSQSRQVVTGKAPEVVNLEARPNAQDD